MTNTISFVFSLFGTGMVIKRFGLTYTMISYPVLLLLCALLVWVFPSIWVRTMLLTAASPHSHGRRP